MKIFDEGKARPKIMNSSYCYIWEIVIDEYDEYNDDYVQVIKARFFDPWNAVAWGNMNYGVGYMCQLSAMRLPFKL